MNQKPTLEACVETLDQAIMAEKYGADRIELCADLSVGGITPPRELIEKIQKQISIPIMAMARPRGGNFVHSVNEIKEIKKAIVLFKKLNIKGVVLGFLTEENTIDCELTKDIVDFAHPLEVTFHKAIDLTPDPVQSLLRLKYIQGIQRILTSGGKRTAEEGAYILKEMILAGGNEISIIVAGKVTKENLTGLHQIIGANEYHGRRIVF